VPEPGGPSSLCPVCRKPVRPGDSAFFEPGQVIHLRCERRRRKRRPPSAPGTETPRPLPPRSGEPHSGDGPVTRPPPA